LPGNFERTREYVLKDVNAISLEEGQKLLAVAIEEPHATLRARDVSDLSMTPSPELDTLLIAKLEGRRTEEMESAAPLVGRYASPAILERVRAVYEVEREAWPCNIEAGLLAYFLRVDASYGIKMLPPALAYAASRQRVTCQRPTLVGAISDIYYSAPIEKAAIAQLDDSSLMAANDAVRVLSAHPSAPALAALLNHFRRFREQWKDFDPQKAAAEALQKWNSTNQQGLESDLVRAIAQSPDYRRHPDMRQQLSQLCVTDRCRSEVLRFSR
jgi:hypothetical protein